MWIQIPYSQNGSGSGSRGDISRRIHIDPGPDPKHCNIVLITGFLLKYEYDIENGAICQYSM